MVVSDPIEMISYVVRHYLNMPKNLTENFNAESISIIYTIAENNNDTDAILSQVKKDLVTVLQRHFPGGNLTIDVSTGELSTNVNYADMSSGNLVIVIYITLTLGDKTYNWNKNVTVDTTTNKIIVVSE